MYLGRIVSVGNTEKGKLYIAYRVSSRSFPNRMAKTFDDKASIIPKEGYEKDIFENAYIAYNCVKIVDDIAIVSNGSHTDVIADKITLGMNIKDAMALSLIAMDYEKDDYNTPRVAGVVKGNPNKEGEIEAYIGIVSDSKILVEKIEQYKASYISTYECDTPKNVKFRGKTPEDSCQFIIDQGEFANFTNPVSSVAAIFENGKWNIASLDL